MRPSLATVQNALGLLDAFSLETPEWGVRQLARTHALPVATVSRLVHSLLDEGFLTQTPAKRYRLNDSLQQIGASAARGLEIYGVALPELLRIRRRTGIATQLSILDDLDVVVLERLSECDYDFSRAPRRRWPAHATAAGKALLAFHPGLDRSIAALAALPACTLHTIVQPGALTKELDDVRVNGYAVENGESQLGWRALAVPIFASSGLPVAAISVETRAPAPDPAASLSTLRLLQTAAAAVAADLP